MHFAAEHEKGCVPATLNHCTLRKALKDEKDNSYDSATLCLRCLECDSSISAICHINTNQHTHTH